MTWNIIALCCPEHGRKSYLKYGRRRGGCTCCGQPPQLTHCIEPLQRGAHFYCAMDHSTPFCCIPLISSIVYVLIYKSYCPMLGAVIHSIMLPVPCCEVCSPPSKVLLAIFCFSNAKSCCVTATVSKLHVEAETSYPSVCYLKFSSVPCLCTRNMHVYDPLHLRINFHYLPLL